MSALQRTRPTPPVRALHLGLGNFFRAHQAWFTHHAADGGEWGIAAFSGLDSPVPASLRAQDCLYTLDVRAPDGDTFEVIESLAAVHDADDEQAWIGYFADPAVQYLTLTVTEAGYRRASDGGLNTEDAAVAADLAALRQYVAGGVQATPGVTTAPARLVAGLLARRAADAGPFTIVPCDNLPGNAAALSRVVDEMVNAVDATLQAWMIQNTSFVSTAVDRITPATTDVDRQRVANQTGTRDAEPVATEPFKEWVLGGRFAGQRPQWETAGAVLTDDVEIYEARKLTLLNGSHSLLAYAGPLRGHATVSQAIADPSCRQWVQQWWDEAVRHLPMDPEALREYCQALLVRYENPAIEHKLAQIAMDGSLKIPVRILPTIRAERAAGRVPEGAARVLAAWACSIRRPEGPSADPLRDHLVSLGQQPLEQAVPALIAVLDADLAADTDLTDEVVRLARELP